MWIHSTPVSNAMDLIRLKEIQEFNDDGNRTEARMGYLGRINYSYADNTYNNNLTPKGYSSFNNFKAREYDYEALERKLLGWD